MMSQSCLYPVMAGVEIFYHLTVAEVMRIEAPEMKVVAMMMVAEAEARGRTLAVTVAAAMMSYHRNSVVVGILMKMNQVEAVFGNPNRLKPFGTSPTKIIVKDPENPDPLPQIVTLV